MKAKYILMAASLLLMVGCGGGGGGAAAVATHTLSGAVLSIDTLAPTNPTSTVQVGSTSVTTDATTGNFNLTVPNGSTTATVTYIPGGGTAQVFTYTFPGITADTDIGDLYVGSRSVTMIGRLVDSSTTNPIAGGTVSFAGRSSVSASDGTFSLTKIAYPTTNVSGFLSLQGSSTATGYFNQGFQGNTSLVGTVISVGDVALVPSASDSPPPLPANAVVTVSPIVTGTTVTVSNGSTQIASAVADSSGHVQFWLPVGTYNLSATQGAQHGSASITITKINVQASTSITLG